MKSCEWKDILNVGDFEYLEKMESENIEIFDNISMNEYNENIIMENDSLDLERGKLEILK